MSTLTIYNIYKEIIAQATSSNGYIDLSEKFLCNSDLQGMTLQGVCFSGSDLRGSVLDNADLYWADLTDCCLVDTSCRFADFRGADLSGAVFLNSDLTGAKFGLDNIGSQTNLSGVDFSGCKILGADFSDAITNNDTVWPK